MVNWMDAKHITALRASAFREQASKFYEKDDLHNALASVKSSISRSHRIHRLPFQAYFLEAKIVSAIATGAVAGAAKKLARAEKENWRAGNLSYKRAKTRFDKNECDIFENYEEYAVAQKHIKNSIKAFLQMPLPPFGAYLLQGKIGRAADAALKRENSNGFKSGSLHEQRLA